MIGLLAVAGLLAVDPAAVRDPASRAGALRAVLALDALALREAREGPLGEALVTVVADPQADFEGRVLAVRAAALLRVRAAVPALATIAANPDDPGSTALARESTRALRQLGAVDALAPLLDSTDPEIRALAAGAGAGGAALCAVLTGDRWPAVRVAAVHGLVRAARQHAACLAPLLADPDPRVAGAALEGARLSGAPELRGPLRAVAGNPKALVQLRSAAFVALAAQGDTGPAAQALRTHLEKGGIEPLARAAVAALALAGDTAALRSALASRSPEVRLDAALRLAGDPESRGALEALLPALPPRSRAQLGEALRGAAPTGPDPADADPE